MSVLRQNTVELRDGVSESCPLCRSTALPRLVADFNTVFHHSYGPYGMMMQAPTGRFGESSPNSTAAERTTAPARG